MSGTYELKCVDLPADLHLEYVRVEAFAYVLENSIVWAPRKPNGFSLGPSHRGSGTISASDSGQSGYMVGDIVNSNGGTPG